MGRTRHYKKKMIIHSASCEGPRESERQRYIELEREREREREELRRAENGIEGRSQTPMKQVKRENQSASIFILPQKSLTPDPDHLADPDPDPGGVKA